MIHEIRKAGIAVVGRPSVLRREVPVVPPLGPLSAGSVDLATVKTSALLGIAEQIVGCRDRLEAVLGCPVTRVQVRVVLLG